MKYFGLRRHFLFILFIAGYLLGSITLSKGNAAGRPGDGLPESGRALYRISCAACHGADGRGAPVSLVGFDTPLPDLPTVIFPHAKPRPIGSRS